MRYRKSERKENISSIIINQYPVYLKKGRLGEQVWINQVFIADNCEEPSFAKLLKSRRWEIEIFVFTGCLFVSQAECNLLILFFS